MQIEGAVIRDQGVSFAVVVVKPHVTSDTVRANAAVRDFGRFFPGLPVVLMSQASNGRPTWFGRRDIADRLAGVPLSAVPWKRYTFN